MLKLKEDEELLMQAISELPENQKTALLLRHTEDFTYREISNAMGLSCHPALSSTAMVEQLAGA